MVLDEMVRYFYSDGNLNLMLTKVLVYMLALFLLATVIGAIRKMRL
jgi:hypothetical protein